MTDVVQVTVTFGEAHSYEVPEILAVPVIEGSSDYLAWVQGELDSGR
jgi:periplasmic divalent cation tolerance protein